MNRTKIEWALNPDGTQGYTWNPITGCLNGCSYCYARKLANGRLRSRYLGKEARVSLMNADGYITTDEQLKDPFYPRFWASVLNQMRPVARWAGGRYNRKPKGVFVCDMSDLFGSGIPEEWTRKVLKVIEAQPTYRFYLLTKQPQNLIKFSPFPDNCWVGVTATDSVMAFRADDALAHIEAKVKYVSFEPLLDRIENPDGLLACLTRHIDWVIIGAQTKPYKPPKIEWIQEIVAACDKAGIPVFLKDNLKQIARVWKDTQEMPEGR